MGSTGAAQRASRAVARTRARINSSVIFYRAFAPGVAANMSDGGADCQSRDGLKRYRKSLYAKSKTQIPSAIRRSQADSSRCCSSFMKSSRFRPGGIGGRNSKTITPACEARFRPANALRHWWRAECRARSTGCKARRCPVCNRAGSRWRSACPPGKSRSGGFAPGLPPGDDQRPQSFRLTARSIAKATPERRTYQP